MGISKPSKADYERVKLTIVSLGGIEIKCRDTRPEDCNTLDVLVKALEIAASQTKD